MVTVAVCIISLVRYCTAKVLQSYIYKVENFDGKFVNTQGLVFFTLRASMRCKIASLARGWATNRIAGRDGR